MHSCLTCTSVCRETLVCLPDHHFRLLEAWMETSKHNLVWISTNTQTPHTIRRHRNCQMPGVSHRIHIQHSRSHDCCWGVGGGGRRAGRGGGGLAMPSVLPDFGTKVKNGHEERMRGYSARRGQRDGGSVSAGSAALSGRRRARGHYAPACERQRWRPQSNALAHFPWLSARVCVCVCHPTDFQ